MNKNTRLIRKWVSQASKRGEHEVVYSRPVYNFHSEGKYETKTVPTAVMGKNGVVSFSRKKNIEMVIIQPVDANGKVVDTMTRHVVLNKDYPAYKRRLRRREDKN